MNLPYGGISKIYETDSFKVFENIHVSQNLSNLPLQKFFNYRIIFFEGVWKVPLMKRDGFSYSYI